MRFLRVLVCFLADASTHAVCVVSPGVLYERVTIGVCVGSPQAIFSGEGVCALGAAVRLCARVVQLVSWCFVEGVLLTLA